VLKRSGAVEDFDRTKLLSSVKIACAKRPVSASQMEALVDDIEDGLSRQAGLEVPSVQLGALVMELLSPMDRVAYVRFASVYRNFQDAGEFQEFVDEMTAAQEREELRKNQVELLF
jgi:transcriptional repressor NrdR